MAIFLTVLKWLGIILLVIVAIVLLILLIVLLVPFKYNARAAVDDPDRHEEFPIRVLKENANVAAGVSWLFGAVKLLIAYPGGELIAVKIFGKDIGIMNKLKKSGSGKEEEKPEEEKEEEKEEKSLEKRAEEISAKVEKAVNAADYVYRVLTGRCGRRAWRKVKGHLCKIADHVLPTYWRILGTVGLADPCLNGRLTGITSMLMPFADEHLGVNTEWELYRCDMEAEMSGRLRLIVPVKEAVFLVFDRDCRKVFKKLLKVRAKLNK